MLISNITQGNNYSPPFQKFLKVKGKLHRLENLKDEIRQQKQNLIPFISKQSPHKGTLYVLTGKDADKFLDLIPQVLFRNLRTKPEKYMKKKAKEVKPSKLIKELIG